VNTLLSLVAGPLAGPECRRAAARGWPLLVRLIFATVAGLVVLTTAWLGWINFQSGGSVANGFDPVSGLSALERIAAVVALLLGPAVLAGAVAGEKERGSLGLLLTTRVNNFEIASGRLWGKLSPVAMTMLAGLPALAWFAFLASSPPAAFATMLALPASVAFGAGGLALGLSSVMRRGRDALMLMYLLVLLALLSSLAGPPLAGAPDLRLISPLAGEVIDPLVAGTDPLPALATVGFWTAIGLLGLGLATARLRPACLRALDGDARRNRRNRRGRRRWFVPPVDENNPMLWKELYIERVSAGGAFGRLVGALLILYLVVWSTWYAVEYGLAYRANDVERMQGATMRMQWTIGRSSMFFAWLIEWAVGLRAAVAIASERERGDWDGLMTSPLEGREIVRAKLWGSLFALRWLLLAAAYAWTVAVLIDAMDYDLFGFRLAEVFLVGAFMAAAGVRASLASRTATRAMGITIGAWLVAFAGVWVSALLITLLGTLILFLVWLWASAIGLIDPNTTSPGGVPVPGFLGFGGWVPISFNGAWRVISLALYVVATLAVVAETGLRFDRLAGRMAGGSVAVAVDEFLHGSPIVQVLPSKPGPASVPSPEPPGAPAPLGQAEETVAG
jgi:ABC-type transport system involved in multi-copper enzyme maturation permease subunit